MSAPPNTHLQTHLGQSRHRYKLLSSCSSHSSFHSAMFTDYDDDDDLYLIRVNHLKMSSGLSIAFLLNHYHDLLFSRSLVNYHLAFTPVCLWQFRLYLNLSHCLCFLVWRTVACHSC